MHTFLRTSGGDYDIGLWLPRQDGLTTFNTLFTVPSLRQAFAAVNMLNGGTRMSLDALQLTEKE